MSFEKEDQIPEVRLETAKQMKTAHIAVGRFLIWLPVQTLLRTKSVSVALPERFLKKARQARTYNELNRAVANLR